MAETLLAKLEQIEAKTAQDMARPRRLRPRKHELEEKRARGAEPAAPVLAPVAGDA
jgi:hypothetical protein